MDTPRVGLHTTSPTQAFKRWVQWALLLAILLIGVAAGSKAYLQQRMESVRDDFQRLLALEKELLLAGGEQQFAALLDQAQGDWYARQITWFRFVQQMRNTGVNILLEAQPRVVRVVLHKDMAWVTLQWQEKGRIYQRMVFYRFTEDRWLRTAPDRRFWGSLREHQTAYFRWLYYARDDQLFAWMRQEAESTYLQRGKRSHTASPSSPILVQVVLDQDSPFASRAAGSVMCAPDKFLITVRSPYLTGILADGSLDPDLKSRFVAALSTCVEAP